MDCFEYAIVGSGPSGVAAARRLAGRAVCIIDVGELPDVAFPYSTLASARTSGDVQALLGEKWEMLANLVAPGTLHPKLRSSSVRHVMRGVPFRVRDAAGETILRGAGSYAAGGMSNVWGAQLLRYTEADLKEAGGWPYKAAVLEEYYTDLEKHIGISGQADDMHEFLGGTSAMMPAAPIVPAAQHLLARYQARQYRRGASNLILGRARLALCTRAQRDQPEYSFGETEFFTANQPGFYTARRTLEELRADGNLTYLDRHELLAFREMDGYVEIELLDRVGNVTRTVRARHLLLGCGTLQTARLVLLNKKDRGRALPFMDHPPTLLPIFLPARFGSALPRRSFPVQLVATLDAAGRRDMITFYYPGAMLWSDLLPDMPVPIGAALRMLGGLLGGMLIAQIWQASRPSAHNRIRLDERDEIVIDYPHWQKYDGLGQLLTALRPLGAYSLKGLASMSPPGWGFHYAGCLPMREHPTAYETHMDGRLWDSRRVRVIDGSVLPSLPAKNHSLTMMANAARIADEVRQCGY